jgi:divalent metal cation (Fe/Co/Zn/Cd) transporter
VPSVPSRTDLQRRALRLEWLTIAWNGVEFAVTVALGIAARSLALIGFGLDTLVELFASVVVVWHLRGEDRPDRARRAHRLIAAAFAVIAVFLTLAAIRALIVGHEADESLPGIAYIALAAVAMFSLGIAKRRIADPLDDEVLRSEATMSILDGFLALSVLLGLVLNAWLDWWWSDPAATLVVAAFAFNEARENLEEARELAVEAGER